MYTKQEIIIRSYREGKSQRRIAHELHLSRKTIRKYIEEYEALIESSESPSVAQSTYLSTAPVYKCGVREKLKLTREVQEAIDGLLSLNSQKKQEGLRKQMLRKKDILEELHRQGYDIGYTTVCSYISAQESTSSSRETFIRQSYLPGKICEFDWCEIKLNLSGVLTRLQLAVFTSAYSNYRYAFIFNRQDTVAFMESHVRFFETVGGVYHQMVYDNMRVAVAKFVGLHEKEPTKALLQLRGHYGFTHRFCNAYRGNEKGHVERSVEYVRRKAFGLKDQFAGIQEAEDWLARELVKLNNLKQTGKEKTVMELFEQEKQVLGVLPGSRATCCDQVQLRVDKYATISYRTNRYSVPDHLTGKFVDVSIHSKELHVFYQNNRVATHDRSFAKHHWRVDVEHYLSTFKRKPGALERSVALVSNIYLKNLYQQYFQGSPRSFIDFLNYCRARKVSEEKLEESVKRVLSIGNGILTTEKLQAILGNETVVQKQLPDDRISQISKQQLSEITVLMYQINKQWTAWTKTSSNTVKS
jgi:transposase